MKSLIITLNLIISACSACDTCASDEWCSNATCTCNSTIYPITDNEPLPTIDCIGGKMNVYISKCWLEKNAYNTTTIRLGNSTCLSAREIVNSTAVMAFHRSLTNNDCKNNVYVNSSHVTYSNTLFIFAKTYLTQSRNDVIMNISCIYPLNLHVQLNTILKPILGSSQLEVPGISTVLTVHMVVYSDNAFTRLLSEETPLYVDSTIYVSVLIQNLPVNSFKIKVLTIYATASESGPTYQLLTNGCPSSGITSNLLTVLHNGNSSESRFSMKVFQITGSNILNLYAEVTVCTADCQTDCSSTGAKSMSSSNRTALVSVNVNAEEGYTDDSANSVFLSWWTLCSVVFSMFLRKLA